jgi:phage tail sheath protein FI
MAYERPGVYVREVPSQTQISTQNTATAAAFLGTALRGPTTPVLINSWSNYVSTFGPLSNDYDLGYAIYSYFANGGRDAYVSRIVASDSVAATAIPTAMTTGGSPASVNLFTLTAKSVGIWANSSSASTGLRATITFDPSTTTSLTATTLSVSSTSVFGLTLTLDGVEVERWQELSLNPTSGRYIKDVLNLFSVYVNCGTPIVIASGSTVTDTVDTGTTSTTTAFTSGTAGSAAINETTWGNALALYNSIKIPLLINFVGQTTTAVVDKALDYAATRGDSFVIIDCGLTTTADTINVSFGGNKGYGAVYFPALVLADPARSGPAAVRNCYPGGTVAGAFIRSETTRGVAKAPAGYGLDLRNVFGLTVSPTEAQEASLYNTKNVNVIRSIPGGIYVINGARTLAANRPDKFITIRRSLNFVKSIVEAQTAFAVFEPNDSRLWTKINNTLSQTLTNFWANGNLKGSSASEAFYIICNSTNNTSTTIGDGFVNVEIGVSLLSPAEFIVINVSQWAGENA